MMGVSLRRDLVSFILFWVMVWAEYRNRRNILITRVYFCFVSDIYSSFSSYFHFHFRIEYLFIECLCCLIALSFHLYLSDETFSCKVPYLFTLSFIHSFIYSYHGFVSFSFRFFFQNFFFPFFMFWNLPLPHHRNFTCKLILSHTHTDTY